VVIGDAMSIDEPLFTMLLGMQFFIVIDRDVWRCSGDLRYPFAAVWKKKCMGVDDIAEGGKHGSPGP
jgi:hypothetical protein